MEFDNRLLFPNDVQFWFEIRRAFGAAAYGGSLFGEVMAVGSRIAEGDYDSWYAAWNAMADRVAATGVKQRERGRAISARDSLLRATTYYQASEFFLHGDPKDPRIGRAYRLSTQCYREAAPAFDPPIEPVEIPYEGTTLPGYFHRSGRPGRSPTIIMHSGFDGSAEEMHVGGARAAVERGYNALAFDGPGQYGPLHRQGLVLRPDWEKVVAPVVDFALARPEVDPARIALMGVSLGGYLAPRAAAFEKRIAALIANDGLYDFGAVIRSRVPADQWDGFEASLKADESPEIDAAMAARAKESPTTRWSSAHGTWATGAKSPRKFLARTLDFTLANGIAEAISCPTLVCEAEDDLFFQGQPQMLYDHLTCPKTFLRFTNEEGAGDHCHVGASRLAFAAMFDWLDEVLA